MDNVAFAIGKELAELRARIEKLEASSDCGCGGKRPAATPRPPISCEDVRAMVVDLIAKANAVMADSGKQLFVKNMVLSTRPALTTEVCCCYNSCGDYCCGDCSDPFCSNFCSSPC